MPWRLVNPTLYGETLDTATTDATARPWRFRRPRARHTFWYQETGSRERSELAIEADEFGNVTWFQLAHTPWPHRDERTAEWRRGGRLYLGTMQAKDDESDDSVDVGSLNHKSPIIHRHSQPPADLLRDLIDYFHRSADVLAEGHRHGVGSVLFAALHDLSSGNRSGSIP